MVDRSIVKATRFCQDLSESQIDQLAEIADLIEIETGQYLNERSRKAEYLYLILDGVVSLQAEDINGQVKDIETLFAGSVLGASSIIDREFPEYMSDALALTPLKALRFRADDMMKLFYQDFELGFYLMKKTAMIMRRRLIYRVHPVLSIAVTPHTVEP